MENRKGIEIHDENLLKVFTEKYGEPVGYGITAVVYLKDNQIIKAFYPGYGKGAAFKEAYMLMKSEKAGLQAPRVLKVEEEEGYWTLYMTKAEGESMLMKIIDNLASDNLDAVRQYVKQLAQIHAEIGNSHVAGLPASKEAVWEKIVSHDVLTEEEKERAGQYMQMLPEGSSLCHGDFHANQVLLLEEGSYNIIDFADVGNGDPAGDAALTWLNLSNAPEPLRPLFSKVDIAELYLSEYVKQSGVPREQVMKWVPLQAAAFLSVAPPYREALEKYLP